MLMMNNFVSPFIFCEILESLGPDECFGTFKKLVRNSECSKFYNFDTQCFRINASAEEIYILLRRGLVLYDGIYPSDSVHCKLIDVWKKFSAERSE